MPLDPNIAGLLQFLESAGYPPLADGTPEDARRGLRALLVDNRQADWVLDVASVTDTTLAGSVPARVYRPHAGADGALSTVVFLHGGGFVIGDLDTHDASCRRLATDTGAVVVSVDYRLAPEHRFPAAVEDAVAAYDHVRAHIEDFGGDADRIALAGDSAGGNLAAVCAQQAHAAGHRVVAQLLIYPAVDLLGEYASREENAEGYFLTLADMRWFAESYLGTTEDDPRAAELAKDPRLSPLLASDLTGLAPAVVATAEFDPLRDEGDAYAEALRGAGVPVQHQQFAGLIHGFYGMEFVSPAVADATRWVNTRFAELLRGDAS